MSNVGSAASGKTLIGAGNGASPTYADIGTNSGLTDHGVVVAQGAGAFVATGPGNAGEVLTSNGAGSDPTFQAIGGSGVTGLLPDTGTSPVVPSGGNITISGGVVAAGTNPIRSNGTGANTLTLQAQISQAIAGTDATKIGLAAFDSASFAVDANGFVTFIGGGGGVNFFTTTYDANDTWTPNASTVSVTMVIVSGGGGGGSGRQGATGSAGGGGGGTGSFSLLYHKYPRSFFGASEAITIGAGGTGGAAQTSDLTNGFDGSNGGNSSVGNIFTEVDTSNFGAGGTSTTTGTTTQSRSLSTLYPFSPTTLGLATLSGVGSNVAPTNVASTTRVVSGAIVGANCFIPSSGAGGGAGANSVTERKGANAGNVTRNASDTTIVINGGIGGIESGTIDGTNGNPGILDGGIYYCGTSGGGGGGQSVGPVAGNGGNGGIPGGLGGGGGGSLSGTNSGAGGDGARGQVVIIEWFT